MLFFLASCSRKEPVVHDAPAPAPAVSTAADFVDAGSDQVANVSAWTDAPIVEKLQSDCGFDPLKLSDAQKTELFGNAYGANQLTCSGNAMDQSCVYDPCFEGDLYDCSGACLKTCESCDDACTSRCFECKANCQDDSCRNACAPTCAQCKQTCVTNQDQCRSGKCEQVYADCRKRLSSDWKSQHCETVCKQFSPCRDACVDNAAKDNTFDYNACVAKCKMPFKTSCDLGLCNGKGGMGIDPL